tara:strand:- start:1423 stop:3312 length:1890 start_codon:yes stop_codon:yes gene_type:complete
MRRAAPWWLGWLLAGGLISIFAGERIFAEVSLARAFLSGLGTLVVLASTALRAVSWRSSEGEARQVERWLLLAYAGCILALIGYLFSSDDGIRWLGLTFADETARARYRIPLEVLWVTLLFVSLLPTLGAQLALGRHRQARDAAAGVEAFRVVEMARSGLVVALAGATLMLLGYVASARDEVLDLSYFKTSSPGAATKGIILSLDEPITAMLFFPDVNPVKDEVLAYLNGLADATDRLRIESYDRLQSPRLAERYEVFDDGTLVFVRGDQSQRMVVGTDLRQTRSTLRTLDRQVQANLLPLLRGYRKVYLTTGHGELNDSSGAGLSEGAPLGRVEVLSEILRFLSYEVVDLGLGDGLGQDVPADAAMVMVLGPRRPFFEAEMASLERFLARGGALLLALDPEGTFTMGPLEQRLGVRYVATPLADEQRHLQQRGDLSDRRLIITNNFTSHESVTSLARAPTNTVVLLVSPGYLDTVEGAAATRRFVVSSLQTTFADLSGDYRFDDPSEQQQPYKLVAAVEGEVAAASNPLVTEPGPMRALVFASSSLFADAVLASIAPNAMLVGDGIKWLGREETFAGATESEADVPIVHTKAENIAWFYATIIGAPMLVLGGGLLGVYRRRHRRGLRS